jgi:GntR family transcriptional regulator, phosphonate transport system regulatory protein
MTNSISPIKRPGLALWRQITDALSAEIEGGNLMPGNALPSESELMNRYDVSRFTVRQAISRLKEQGFVETQQGRGAFVRGPVVQYTISERARFASSLKQQGFEVRNEFLATKKLYPDKEIAQILEIGAGKYAWRITALSFANDEPLSLGCIFHPADRFPDIVERRRKSADMTVVYAGYGIENYARQSTWISTRIPTEDEADLLAIDLHDPVIVSQKVDVDAEGVPIEYNETIFSGRKTRLHFPSSSHAASPAQVSPPSPSKTVLDPA